MFSYAFFDLLRNYKFYVLYLYAANNLRSTAAIKTLVTALLAGAILQGALCTYKYKKQDVSHVFGNLFGQKDLYRFRCLLSFI